MKSCMLVGMKVRVVVRKVRFVAKVAQVVLGRAPRGRWAVGEGEELYECRNG